MQSVAEPAEVNEWETKMMRSLIAGIVLAGLALPAQAGFCDYTPSKLIGGGATTAAAAGAGAVGGAGAAGSAAGLYAITNGTTGVMMLGSTAGGASAAGTVGIMGGTAGASAGVMSVVLNPLVWIPAAVVAAGTGLYEGGCWISGE